MRAEAQRSVISFKLKATLLCPALPVCLPDAAFAATVVVVIGVADAFVVATVVTVGVAIANANANADDARSDADVSA